ncbi:hypothetical protein E8D34_13080 [Nocardioides sp. GY 10113]|uniref:hypothetical protein n=1 Tax=Nocardioides sp. GY 10113 TaxID=2569761 RepID=UPI0010A8220A|nr:hypothetical protein [Nocardioides sp. GY 10113]TIC85013.1 hypothetical protein E8D34_13080 [Nocardioides sp. GY 10113]
MRSHLTSGRVGLVLGLFALVLALGLPSQAVTGGAQSTAAAKAQAGPKAVKVFGAAKTGFINDFTETDYTPIVTKKFRTAKGYLAVTGTVGAEDDFSLAGAGRLQYNLRIDGKLAISDSLAYQLTHVADQTGNAGAITIVVPVKARKHNVQLVAREAGTGSFVRARQLSIVYTPGGQGVPTPARPIAPRAVHQ